MRRASVGDVMTRDVVTVHPDTPFTEIVRLMTEGLISGVPVLHPNGSVLKLVSKAGQPVVDDGDLDGGFVADGELVVSGGNGAVAFSGVLLRGGPW
jgi:CBS domain-containing protein